MKIYRIAIFLILTMLVLSFSNEPPKKTYYDQVFDSNSFYKFYDQSADSLLDYAQRIKLINQAYKLAKESGKDGLLIKSLRRKAYLHSKNKQHDSAVYFSREMLGVATKTKDSVVMGISFNRLGRYYEDSQVLDSSFFYFDKAKKMSEQLGDSLEVAKNAGWQAILLSNIGQYILSDEMAIEALTYLINIDAPIDQATLYNCMAINAKDQHDLEEAFYWYDLAIRTTTSKKNRTIYLSNIANLHREKGEYTKAIDLYESLMNDLKNQTAQDHFYRNMNNLTFTRWLQTKDIGLEDQLLEQLELRRKEDGTMGAVASLKHLTHFYLEWNREKGVEHALDMYEQASKIDHVGYRLQALQFLMRAHDKDLKKHNKYARLYMSLEDSLQKVNVQLGNKFAKIRFNSDQNRLENENLKKVNLQKELELSKSQQRNTIFIALGVISMISFFFIYTMSRSRYQKEKLQEVFQTEARISKKVHDEVANDLYQVMTKLDHHTDQNDKLLDDLEQIYEKTRDISRENNEFDQQQDFGILLSDLLSNYSNDQINIITRGLNQMNWSKTDHLTKKTIYRVVQELLTNMKKHSMASVVILSFTTEKNKTQIKYSDDGIGAELKKHNGLLNMENRITNLGGSLTLASEKGKGFKASIIV